MGAEAVPVLTERENMVGTRQSHILQKLMCWDLLLPARPLLLKAPQPFKLNTAGY